MQRNYDSTYAQTNGADVYAGVQMPFFETGVSTDTQEFSLASIQEKLGATTLTNNEVVEPAVTEDIMPSSQTMHMTFERNYTAEQKATQTKFSTKQKIMVASYVAIVLSLAIAITLCGIAVNASFGSFISMDATYTELQSASASLDSQLAVDNTAELLERATQLGYVDASSSGTVTRTYEKIETRSAQDLSVEGNWFDTFRDWINSIFAN